MDTKKLANILFPNIKKTVADYEKEYPKRKLNKGEEVCRVAPSPTGRVHMGTLYASFIPEVFAYQSGGIFIIRIEDTDDKRAIENGTELILSDLKEYNYNIDENPIIGGPYAPYVQSERKEIYNTFGKHLTEIGRAYPCFCSEEEVTKMRERQETKKDRIGYYGRYAKCRNLTLEEIEEKINNNEKWVLRLKSNGDFNKKIEFKDLIKGKMNLNENDIDHVLLKSDGIPPYAFAHVVDDYLMGTTTVHRGDEYVSSVPYHLEIWDAFGFNPPKYAHILPLNIKDGNSVRKLSKRKDPEAAISFHHEKGVPKEAIKLYFATILNTNFEDWYMQNPAASYRDFTFTYEKTSKSAGLFDMEKLINISKNYLSRLSAEEVYDNLLIWTEEFDKDFNELITKHKDYTIALLNIERQQAKPRKDFAFYSEIKDNVWYMYDELFDQDIDCSLVNNKEDLKTIINDYFGNYYDINNDKENWFKKIKELATKHGYASEMSDYKTNPDNYKGSVADISNMIRVAVTNKTMTPDLYEILKILGKERINLRIKKICG